MRPSRRREVSPGPRATSGPSTHRPAASEGRDEDETKRRSVDALVFSAKHPLAPKGDNSAGTSARATGGRGGSTFCRTVCEWHSGRGAAGGAGHAPRPVGPRRRAGAPAGPPTPRSPPGDAAGRRGQPRPGPRPGRTTVPVRRPPPGRSVHRVLVNPVLGGFRRKYRSWPGLCSVLSLHAAHAPLTPRVRGTQA